MAFGAYIRKKREEKDIQLNDFAKLLEISRQFHIYGDLLHAEPCKIGHINETYIATYHQGGIQLRYVLQRINTNVFKDPDAVMDNKIGRAHV